MKDIVSKSEIRRMLRQIPQNDLKYIEYLVQDIKDPKSKPWLKTALISELIDGFLFTEEHATETVEAWFSGEHVIWE